MTANDSTRQRALELLRRGIITQAEAADKLGMTRQGAREMCMRADIDAVMARHRYLRALFDTKIKPPTTT